MKLHLNKEVFSEIISATVEEFGLRDFQVEKDYYVSLLLSKIAASNSRVSIVFKGGTALSKCYSLIDRFSEDIDLAVMFDSNRVSDNERRLLKTIIIENIKESNMELINLENIRSRRDYNEYKVNYNKSFDSDDEMVSHIIVETIVSYRPFPSEKMKVSNYITKYLERTGRQDLIDKYELEPFEMPIQTLERTFVDKIFATCDYHMHGKYNRYSRHLYDIHKIWNSGLLDLDKVIEILPTVIKDRQMKPEINLSCVPGVKPKEVLEEIIKKEVYKQDYNKVTSTFLYVQVEYEECIKTIRSILKEGLIPKIID